MTKTIQNRFKKGIATAGVVMATATGGTIATDQIVFDVYTDTPQGKQLIVESDVINQTKDRAVLNNDTAEVTLKRWDDTASLVIKRNTVIEKGKRRLLSNSFQWDSESETSVLTPIEGGLKFDVILQKKPKNNIVEWTVEGGEQFDWYYQDSLAKENPNEKCTDIECVDETGEVIKSRPESVVGSYAVYHKTFVNHIEGKTNYATGKFTHIFRPKIISADKKEVWGILHYSNNTLSVEIPKDFKGLYPLHIDPTFGYTTQGGSDATLATRYDDGGAAQLGTAITGTLTDVSAYIKKSGTPANTVSLRLYSSSGGVPSSNLVGSSPLSLTTSYALKTATLSYSMTGSDYFAVALSSALGSSGSGSQIAYDSGSGSGAYFGSLSWAADTNRYSVYATYTASGGSIKRESVWVDD